MRQITADDHLRALALFTMGRQHVKEAERCAEALAKVLGAARYNVVEDELWDVQNGKSFDDVLKLGGFEVSKPEAT